jgi:class 3 adenylate cyclase
MGKAESSEPVQSIEDWAHLSDKREASGNYLGACDAALLGLEQHPEARALQYRAVLNLSRMGASKRARQLWLYYRLKSDLEDPSFRGGFEENIAALGARLDREEAYVGDAVQRSTRLKQAALHYEAVYKRSTGTFPGINAAVLHELSGNSVRACELAAHVATECTKANPRSNEEAYQLAADRAAANLLLGNLDDAQRAIEHAAALAGNAVAIASTRKQLIQICDYKGFDQTIASELRNRAVIHYTGHMIASDGVPGRFPSLAEAQVTERIQSELANNNVGYGYGSLACGADTLIVESLLDRDGEVTAILPFETDSFVRESVANGGTKWSERFDQCLKQVDVIHATDGEYVGDPEVFAYASRLAMGLAIVRAQQLCSEVLQLAVWDGQESKERAGTFADIQVWRGHNLKTVTIGSEGNLPPNLSGAEQQRQPFRSLPPRKVRAIMFGDFHGFSRLNDGQMLTFYDHVMDRVASVLDKYTNELVTRNTWGDGLFLVFSDLGCAARCALELQSELAYLDFHSLGLPASLGLRLGLDAGAVFEVRDPILKSASFTGSHINRTARLEPNTPPGEVYVTEAFAALVTLLEQRDFLCEYVGMMKTPKNYGRLRTYLLRRRAKGRLATQIGIIGG